MKAEPTLAVVHPDFSQRGGAESVGMCVLETLQTEYDLTLITMSTPDFDALNEYYSTTVDRSKIEVRTHGPQQRPFTTATASTVKRLTGFDCLLLQIAGFYRSVRSVADEFDLLVSTYNELGDCGDSVQYVHHPLFDRSVLPGRAGTDSSVYAAYDRACQFIAGVSFTDQRDTRVLTNSDWMGNRVKQAYGVESTTLYPPIDTDNTQSVSWSEKEQGFVTLGRLSSDKNIQRNIEIIDRLRERGHDLHLHIAGPPTDPEVVTEVTEMAHERPYIKLDGQLSRKEVTALLNNHRFGLHGKEYEHFGMVVAEMSLAGMLPFAHDSGGQREIVNEEQRLLYEDIDDAVEKIHHVLTDSSTQSSLRKSLPDIDSRFGRSRFKEEFRTVVKNSLAD
ncbi:hypothetical protein DEQ92_14110 [Haloferax sp. Atlit-6N]|uniref:glycosyltransferase family 4 protein n=1 Tax=Haloferax sp. Atlit-6N TaxID=2077205 RepID=UPI000E2281EF|nr:glycosyltransferase family 4 protein [Haloferax sp. Atlit-6N]REA02036.1 hypothetical protein DEQ92_14110 [Haloferax sp. Atlit-6N]